MAPPAPRRRRKPIFARSSRAPEDAWLAALRGDDEPAGDERDDGGRDDVDDGDGSPGGGRDDVDGRDGPPGGDLDRARLDGRRPPPSRQRSSSPTRLIDGDDPGAGEEQRPAAAGTDLDGQDGTSGRSGPGVTAKDGQPRPGTDGIPPDGTARDEAAGSAPGVAATGGTTAGGAGASTAVASETAGTGPDTDAAPQQVATEEGRGRRAESPTDIPATGWKDVLARTFAEAKSDHVPLLAAGVAFFGLLALVPAMVAFVSLYGLLADPSDVARHVGDLLGAAPSEVQDLVTNQLEAVTEDTSGSIGFGLAAGVLVALWSASSGMKHVIEALNAAYDEEEGRGFVRQRGLALLFTVGAVLFMVAAVVVLTVVPAILEGSPLGPAAEMGINIARWPALAVAFAVGLAVLYRYGPSRDAAEWRWVTPGAGVATVLWIVASAGFSLYVARFGSYNETYGSLGGIVVAMLWLFLTAYVVLMGAELDAEMERQTLHDSTEGSEEPLGERDAMAADTVGATANEVKAAKHTTKTTANR